MRSQSIGDLVQERIDKDRRQAQAHVKKVLRSGKTSEAEISGFFPELDGLVSRPGNLPSGVPLLHQLILGPPTVFDLEPLTPQEFERRYRISIDVAEDLADRSLLIPNIWVRNAKAWTPEHQRLAGLVGRALVNGERVDAYLNAKNPHYEKFISEHTEELSRRLRRLKKKSPASVELLVKASRTRTPEEMPRVVGTRWAYLDVLAPIASEYVSQLVVDSKLEEAFDFIRVTKHVYVSATTAAIGGNFTWGSKDIARLEKVGTSIAEPVRFSRTTHDFQKPERLEFLIRHITRVTKIRILADCEAQAIVRVLDDRDLVETKKLFFDVMDVMCKLAQRSEVDTEKVEEWVRLHSEIRRQLRSLQRLARVGVTATVGAAVGIYLNPFMGVGAGEIVKALSREVVDRVGERILRFSNPDRHRFLHLLDKVTGIDQ